MANSVEFCGMVRIIWLWGQFCAFRDLSFIKSRGGRGNLWGGHLKNFSLLGGSKVKNWMLMGGGGKVKR